MRRRGFLCCVVDCVVPCAKPTSVMTAQQRSPKGLLELKSTPEGWHQDKESNTDLILVDRSPKMPLFGFQVLSHTPKGQENRLFVWCRYFTFDGYNNNDDDDDGGGGGRRSKLTSSVKKPQGLKVNRKRD
ncbi:hypothetical protein B0O99DRAFT_673084 [Bisporella sp. PMI_857]|nr:hypothetical protein B0O99DRAFT_673084 [Bisporella sp. PMI_857]